MHVIIGLTNLTNYSMQQFLCSFILLWTLDSKNTCTFVIFVRTTMLHSQPLTISVVLDICCSETLHRTMLIWLLCDQSDMCFTTFVMNHEVKSASNTLNSKKQIPGFSASPPMGTYFRWAFTWCWYLSWIPVLFVPATLHSTSNVILNTICRWHLTPVVGKLFYRGPDHLFNSYWRPTTFKATRTKRIGHRQYAATV